MENSTCFLEVLAPSGKRVTMQSLQHKEMIMAKGQQRKNKEAKKPKKKPTPAI